MGQADRILADYRASWRIEFMDRTRPALKVRTRRHRSCNILPQSARQSIPCVPFSNAINSLSPENVRPMHRLYPSRSSSCISYITYVGPSIVCIIIILQSSSSLSFYLRTLLPPVPYPSEDIAMAFKLLWFELIDQASFRRVDV